jgi:dinuclear metal center YbgI/SA1388 family protein
MKITGKHIADLLEHWAPLSLQESYDNSGWLVGDPDSEVTGVLCTLDCTEEVLEEAKLKGCNLIVAHHPIWFGGKKRLGSHYTDRVIIQAVQWGIGIYACHTNADAVETGVNAKILEKMGLKNGHILSPRFENLQQLTTFVPVQHADEVRQALFDAGAGWVGNYSHASFNTEGVGTFKGEEGSAPTLGRVGQVERVQEMKIEVLVPKWKQREVISALHRVHPYEEVAYFLTSLQNEHHQTGMGMVGELNEAISWESFVHLVKTEFHVQVVRHTRAKGDVKKIAVCGGSGSFLLNDAIRAGADVFLTADFKYHEFFEADGKIVVADIGHYETEQFTSEIFCDLIQEKFPNFAVLKSTTRTNPVNYS